MEKEIKGFSLSELCNEQKNLSKEETNSLVIQAKNGDKDAVEKLILHNGRLINFVIKKNSFFRFYCGTFDYEDLYQQGMLGLLRAIQSYDETKGAAFSTYAVLWIFQSITRFLAVNSSNFYVPVHIQQLYIKIQQFKNKKEKAGETVTDERIMRYFNISKETYLLIQESMKLMKSIDETVAGEDNSETTIGELYVESSVCIEEDVIGKILEENIIDYCKERLSEREYDILAHRIGLEGYEEMTLEDLGDMYGVTRERVRQIEKRAKEKISGVAKRLLCA